MKEPMYKKIENYIKSLIKSSELKEGSLIPSEKQLSEEFGVTRMTARTALNNLAKEGYISRQRGIGSIVLADRIYDNISAVSGFTKEMKNKGYKVSNILVGLEAIESNEDIKKRLNLKDGEKVWEIKRIRLANEIRLSYMVTYMPVKLFPDLSKIDCEGSLYHYIENVCKYKIAISEREVQAMISDEYLEQYLNLSEKEPILHIIQTCKLQNSEIFEYSHTYHYGYTLTINAIAE